MHRLFTFERNLNDLLRFTHQERDCAAQSQFNDAVLSRESTLVGRQSASPLHSRSGSVYLEGTLCFDLARVLQNRPLLSFLTSPGADLMQSRFNMGKLGPSLYVSPQELQYALRYQFYVNPLLIGQAFSLLSEFNLALSVMVTDHLVLEAKKKFIISVGKISIRDGELSQSHEHPVPRSFFPLVDEDASPSKNKVEANSQRLTKLMISQAQDILKEIFARRRSFEKYDAAFQAENGGGSAKNHLLSRLDHDLLELLVFTLGSISCQISASDGLLKEGVRDELQGLV